MDKQPAHDSADALVCQECRRRFHTTTNHEHHFCWSRQDILDHNLEHDTDEDSRSHSHMEEQEE